MFVSRFPTILLLYRRHEPTLESFLSPPHTPARPPATVSQLVTRLQHFSVAVAESSTSPGKHTDPVWQVTSVGVDRGADLRYVGHGAGVGGGSD